MISADIHTKALGGVPILGRIALDVAAGETVAVVGPSGIGKTTLLRVLAGLDTDFDGRISVPDCRAMVFQEPALMPWRTALRNLTLVTGADDDTAIAALDEVGLADLADRFPGQLSLGQRRRLSLARAFVARPDMLLLDEPFVSLDAPLVAEMVELTARLLAARSIATVLVTHSPAEADRLAQRMFRLHGSPATLTELPR